MTPFHCLLEHFGEVIDPSFYLQIELMLYIVYIDIGIGGSQGAHDPIFIDYLAKYPFAAENITSFCLQGCSCIHMYSHFFNASYVPDCLLCIAGGYRFETLSELCYGQKDGKYASFP